MSDDDVTFTGTPTTDNPVITGVWNFDQKPVFPFSVTFSGASVTLHADGTWSGDVEAFRQAAQNAKGSFGDHGLLVWLLLRELIRDDERGFR